MSKPGILETRIIETLDGVDAIAEAWRGLEIHCADPLSYFQSYDWCSTWLRHFNDAGTRPYVVTLWLDDLLVAVWPRMIVEAAGLRRLETLGVPHSQYCGALVRQGAAGASTVGRMMRDAMRASGADITISRSVPEGSALAGLLVDKPVVAGSENVASILDLTQYSSSEDYAQQLGKVQKRNRNRRRNHLARLGELDFQVIWPGHEEFKDLVQLATTMKRRWLTETGRYSVGFAMAGYGDFLADLDGDEAVLRGACLSVLRAGDRVVALELGFIQNRHYYAYIGGFDWDLKDMSPGKVQMDMTVSWLIDAGVSGYDLLINRASYKESWTNRTISITTRAEALTWKGWIYAGAWLPTVRPALKRLHAWAPAAWQSTVNWLRPAACLLLYV
ncbi:GNAT family N-acetyltransferase [Devosia lacusdianchii]|uniref:GNAT family N-acetyltransferase n=1 Tax=Devosia lacusdianchii TaxID=2917991 RepID=UPI001F0561C6|nr:GNAT family N-acetyltransferase [Devosia sp. JXJ CY 41]